MSFILDALKKLEQKQKQNSVPDLSTVHTPNLHKPKKRHLWPYLVLIALLLNAGILAAWLRPWSTAVDNTPPKNASEDNRELASAQELKDIPEATSIDKSSPETQKAAETQPDPIKPETSSKPAIAEQVPSVGRAGKPSAIVTEKPVPEVSEEALVQSLPEEQVASLDLSPSVEELEILKETIKTERELVESNNVPADEQSSDSYEDKPEREILELSELSSEIRKEIPDISIIGHIYSSRSSSRLANINGSLVREGDIVSGKLKVNEITLTGVIFDYDGLRFRVRAF